MRSRPSLFLFGLVTLAVAVTACTPTHLQSTFDPVGPIAQRQMDLFVLIFWVAAFVFVVVEGLLLYTVLRFRRKPGSPEIPPQTHGNTRLEIAWTIAPALVLIVVMVPTVRDIFRNATPPTESNPVEITVTGHQWWWEFEYPEQGVVTANELHIPAGQVVNLTLLSEDVIHSFWAPKIGGKRDVIPGRANQLWLQADIPGLYYGQCAELCGVSHANMRFHVVVDSQEDFDTWLAAQKQAAPEPTTEQAQAGKQLFTEGTACWTCHTVEGTRAQGKVGPDLTHIASRQYIAAGLLENTDANLDRWIAGPQEVKPAAKMPALSLSQQQRDDIIAYLQTLK